MNSEAEFCGRVPLNQTNLVQPHGYLLIIDQKNLRILQVSENVEELFQKPFKEILNDTLADYLPDEQIQLLRDRFRTGVSGRIPFLFSFNGASYLTTVKLQDSCFVLELEKNPPGLQKEDTYLSIYQELKFVMAAIDETNTTQEACEVVIRELKRLSGFDKIMVYQFDGDYNGDVIAESREEGMESYLGLKFPASDIPKQARDLYQRIPYRLIPNVNYVPVKLFPVINPVTNTLTDLSDSNLRSVAGVHLEYLKNMNVAASMSTRILKNNALWGLIACHHRTPKYLSFEKCSVFELLSNTISAKISALQNKEAFDLKAQSLRLQTRILENLYKEDARPIPDDKLLQLLRAGGVAVVTNGYTESTGRTPNEDEIDDLILWLQSMEVNSLYSQASLPAVYEPAEMYAGAASGLLVLPLQPEKKSFILAFRPEEVQTVSWGGNPNETVRFEPDGRKYHPRASFEIWQQNLSRTAVPWSDVELEIAEDFRSAVVELMLAKTER